ncbi:tetratricopeptide repeat protein [uncultured Dokdonia sp.]|uniref:tetratricopeptide repeat protein n=1 Tax=uncultured Dokdonia sp. TaxID=575653 RepID=UPI00262C0197|nr:tetratricopeptide repeat protein [uncultured Dokdonia sp.]
MKGVFKKLLTLSVFCVIVTIQAQTEKQKKEEVMATIICECLENASSEDLSKNFEKEFNNCHKASVLGALLSGLPTDKDSTITLNSDGSSDEVSEEDSEKAIAILENDCEVYKNAEKQQKKSQEKEQTEFEVIAQDACDRLSNVSLSLPRKERYKSIKQEITGAIIEAQIMNDLLNSTEKAIDSIKSLVEAGNFKNTDSITFPGTQNVVIADKNYEEIEAYLLENCDQMKSLMTNNEESSEVSISDKKKARKYYDDGQAFFQNADYDNAIKSYKKAVRKDKTFAFAWDMLGYSYRKNENYEEAITAYDKSLALDPKGKMPLTNKPIAYALLGNFDKAIEGYLEYIQLFPDDPEGYYGIGRIYRVKEDYENALDATMKAYIMYKEIESPYVRDAEANLSLYYKELKEKNKLEIWNKIAEEYNIQIAD